MKKKQDKTKIEQNLSKTKGDRLFMKDCIILTTVYIIYFIVCVIISSHLYYIESDLGLFLIVLVEIGILPLLLGFLTYRTLNKYNINAKITTDIEVIIDLLEKTSEYK